MFYCPSYGSALFVVVLVFSVIVYLLSVSLIFFVVFKIATWSYTGEELTSLLFTCLYCFAFPFDTGCGNRVTVPVHCVLVFFFFFFCFFFLQ